MQYTVRVEVHADETQKSKCVSPIIYTYRGIIGINVLLNSSDLVLIILVTGTK